MAMTQQQGSGPLRRGAPGGGPASGSSNSSTTPMAGHFGRSVDEVRSFVASLRGRSAADAMGMVARSSLVRATALSLLVQVGLLALLSWPLTYLMPEPPRKPASTITPISPPPSPAAAPAAATAADAAKPDAGSSSATPPANANRPAATPDVSRVMRTDSATPEETQRRTRDPLDDLLNDAR